MRRRALFARATARARPHARRRRRTRAAAVPPVPPRRDIRLFLFLCDCGFSRSDSFDTFLTSLVERSTAYSLQHTLRPHALERASSATSRDPLSKTAASNSKSTYAARSDLEHGRDRPATDRTRPRVSPAYSTRWGPIWRSDRSRFEKEDRDARVLERSPSSLARSQDDHIRKSFSKRASFVLGERDAALEAEATVPAFHNHLSVFIDRKKNTARAFELSRLVRDTLCGRIQLETSRQGPRHDPIRTSFPYVYPIRSRNRSERFGEEG